MNSNRITKIIRYYNLALSVLQWVSLFALILVSICLVVYKNFPRTDYPSLAFRNEQALYAGLLTVLFVVFPLLILIVLTITFELLTKRKIIHNRKRSMIMVAIFLALLCFIWYKFFIAL